MTTSKGPQGAQIKTFRPPAAGSDLLNAPRSVLKGMGLWPALAHPDTRRRWSKLLGRDTEYIEPVIEWNKGGCHLGNRPAIKGADDPTAWSGALVYAPSGSAIRSVTGQWTVPTTISLDSGAPTYSAFWIGIDGDANPGGSRDVCQIGIECDTGNSGTPPFYCWWEWYPDGQVPMPLLISPGDAIACQLTIIDPTGTTPLQASILMKNLTTNQAAPPSFYIPVPRGAAFKGNCAEWIAERPLSNDQPTRLTNYGAVTFTGCSASTGTQINQPGPGNTQSMTQNNTVISQAISPNPGTVLCRYTGPQS